MFFFIQHLFINFFEFWNENWIGVSDNKKVGSQAQQVWFASGLVHAENRILRVGYCQNYVFFFLILRLLLLKLIVYRFRHQRSFLKFQLYNSLITCNIEIFGNGNRWRKFFFLIFYSAQYLVHHFTK